MSVLKLKKLVSLSVVFSAMVLSGCSQITVNEDYDSKADFQSLQTFQWLPANLATNEKIAETRAQEPLMSARIQHAIEKDLIAKGLQFSQNQPSHYVSFYVNSHKYMTPDSTSFQVGFGRYYHHFGTGMMFETPPDYVENTRSDLIIQMFDSSGKVIWQSEARIALDMDGTPKAKEAAVQALVTEMLKNFPPK